MSIKQLKLPKINHKVLVIGGAAIILFLFAYTVVIAQVEHNKQLAREVAIADNNRAVLNNLNKRLDALELQNVQLQSDKAAACQYLQTVQVAKATRGLVTIPTTVHCK